MPKMFASVFALLAFVLVGALGVSPTLAQQRIHVAQSGRPIAIAATFQCDPRYGTPAPSGSAWHGRVIARLVAGNRCGNPRQPIMALIYVSNPGFRGTDQAFIHLGGGG